MTTPAPIDPAVLEQVRTLSADRQRLELWIAGIERASVDAPSHVRERVRADYAQRHATVDGQLRAHVAQLVPLLQAFDQRAAEIAAQAQREADERAEAQLRHAVGEYDDARWRDVRQRADNSLTALASEHKRVEKQRTELQQVLALVGDEAIRGVEVTAPPARPVAPVAPAMSAAVAPPPAMPSVAASASAVLSVAKPVVTTTPLTTPTPKVQEPQPLTLSLDIEERHETERSTGSMDAMSSANRGREISAVTSQDTTARTLRCGECGTMNRPTEWYCEKCGGELAAL